MHRIWTMLAALVTIAALPLAALAQDATPAATPVSLQGVTPLPLTDERQAELGAYISDILARTQVPGAAVAVVQNGKVVYLQGFGVRELGGEQPVTPETLMMIGSITKSMTATMAATLVDSDDLTWETPVVDLLPDFAVADPALSERLTVRDAFCACTGMPQRDADFIFNSDTLSPDQLIASVADVTLTAPLGELFQYSNQMFAIGGYAATVAAGGNPDDLHDDYVATMRERILNPLGMPESTFSVADVRASGNFSASHGQNLSGGYEVVPLEDEDSFVRAVAPAGALWSNAAAVARYLQMELADGVAPDGERVVSPENLQATWQQQVAIPPRPDAPAEFSAMAQGYALGWVIGEYHGQPLIWHNGGTFGFSAQMAFLPDADLGIVVLSNGAGADALTLAIQYRLFEIVFDQPRTFDAQVSPQLAATRQALADLQSSLVPVDAQSIAPYLGQYHHDVLGNVTISLQDGTLLFDLGEFQTRLRPLPGEGSEPTTYLMADPPMVGAAARFTMRDGQPTMEIVEPLTGEAFTFSLTDGATPAATPGP